MAIRKVVAYVVSKRLRHETERARLGIAGPNQREDQPNLGIIVHDEPEYSPDQKSNLVRLQGVDDRRIQRQRFRTWLLQSGNYPEGNDRVTHIVVEQPRRHGAVE